MSNKIIWKTVKRKVKDLIPYERNPRQMTTKQAEDLQKSLEKFNLAEIPAIDTDNKIIAGHQRITILKKLGKENEIIDVRVPSRKLTEKEFEEYNLRSNKNIGEWNLDLLANFDETLLKDIGFDSAELDKIFQLDTSPQDDEVPEIKTTKIKLGDMFQLGEHRLLCGDCTIKENVEKLTGKERANMVFTDPPYGVNYEGGSSNKTKRKDSYFDYFSEKEYQDLIRNAFISSFDFIKNTAPYYIWFGDGKIYSFITGCREAGLKEKYCVIWRKLNPHYGALGRQYKIQHEPCLYASKNKFAPKWYGNSKQGTIWEIEQPHQNKLHPTMKPIELCSKAILNSSQRNDIVLDMFLGSGSTLIACEKTNRKCYGMEIEPLYCQVIIDRWEKYTNQKAVKI